MNGPTRSRYVLPEGGFDSNRYPVCMNFDFNLSYELALILSWGLAWPAGLVAMASGQVPRALPRTLVVPVWLAVATAVANQTWLWWVLTAVTVAMTVAGTWNARSAVSRGTSTIPSAFALCCGLLLVATSALTMSLQPAALGTSLTVLHVGVLVLFAARVAARFATRPGALIVGAAAGVAVLGLVVPLAVSGFVAAAAAVAVSIFTSQLVAEDKVGASAMRLAIGSSAAAAIGAVAGLIPATTSVAFYALCAWAVLLCLAWMKTDAHTLMACEETHSKDCSGCCGCSSSAGQSVAAPSGA